MLPIASARHHVLSIKQCETVYALGQKRPADAAGLTDGNGQGKRHKREEHKAQDFWKKEFLKPAQAILSDLDRERSDEEKCEGIADLFEAYYEVSPRCDPRLSAGVHAAPR